MKLFTLCHFLSIDIGMIWNIEDAGNLFFKLESKLGFYLVVPTKPRKTAERITLSFVEMQQLTDSEKIHSKRRNFRLRMGSIKR